MNWSLASATMEQRAIKTDVIASEDAYFMATHVPFDNLEILRGGSQLVDGHAFGDGDGQFLLNGRRIKHNQNLIVVVGGGDHIGALLQGDFAVVFQTDGVESTGGNRADILPTGNVTLLIGVVTHGNTGAVHSAAFA